MKADIFKTTKIYEFDAEHSIVESTRLMPGVVSHQQVPEFVIPIRGGRYCIFWNQYDTEYFSFWYH